MRIDEARYEGGWLMLKTSAADARKLVYQFKAGDYEVAPSRKKRSINANDYLWKLCTEIADAVGDTKENVYRDAVAHVGVYRDFHGIAVSEAPTLRKAWEMLGTGWVTEQVDFEPDGERVVIRAYYGSSQYNSKQMSRLIDWVCQQADNLGIDTDTGRVRSLLEEWDKNASQNQSVINK